MRKAVDHRAWLGIALRPLLSLIIGTVVSVAGLLLMALGLGIVADASGSGSFQWSLGPLHFLTFSKLESGFNTQLGDGMYYLAVLAGVVSALVTARRLHRQQNASSSGPRR